MECPNCKMNIKDGSEFCIHCGTNFGSGLNQNQFINNTMNAQPASNAGQPLGAAQIQADNASAGGAFCPSCGAAVKAGNHFCISCGARITDREINNPQPMSNQNSNQTNPGNPKPLTTNTPEREKYYQAYFGSSYESVRNGNFSVGTLFFSWLWLLLYKLYSQAGSLFLTLLAVDFVGGLISLIIPGVKGIISLGTFAFTLVYVINYAKEFNFYRMEKADKDIDDVFRNYINEEDRLAACKRKGGINVFILILFIAYILLPFGILYLVINSVSGTIKTGENTFFLSDAKSYGTDTKTKVLAEDFKPIKGHLEANKNYYVLIDSTKNDKTRYPLQTNTYREFDYGYVIYEYTGKSDSKAYVCLVSKKEDKSYYIKGESDTLQRTDIQVYLNTTNEGIKDFCNIKTDIKANGAIQLVGNNK